LVLISGGATFSNYTGSVTAYGGTQSGCGVSCSGAAGTVYEQTAAQASGAGSLIINNNNISTEDGTVYTLIPSGINLDNFSSIIINGDGNLGIGQRNV